MRNSVLFGSALAAAMFCVSAVADNGNHGSFRSSVIGSTPGVTIGGVMSGGVPWTVRAGSAEVNGNGKIEVNVNGLLIAAGTGVPANLVGTTGPVMMVAASLVCGGSGGMVAASTKAAPLSAAGNAEIEDTITLPASCMAPVVLVRVFNATAMPGSQLGPFIALSGINAGAAKADNDKDDHDD